MSHPIVLAQEIMEGGCEITAEERARLRGLKFPGDPPLRRPMDAHCYRRGVDLRSVRRWQSDHAARLASLERAEGLR